jgi:thiol-disulfide isomerase/thioredoxin
VLRFYAIFIVLGTLLASAACKPAAAPVAVGNKPVSVNGVPVRDAQPQARKPLPEMSWTGLDGTVYKLRDFEGKVVIMDFWATYCKPCIEEIPHLKELQAKYGEDKLIVVGLHVGGEEDQPKVPEFVKNLDITYRLGYPEDDLMGFVFGQEDAIPQTAIFDASGKFVKKITGFSPQLKNELDNAVESAVRQNG